jgi:hypothetical protein
MRVSRAALFFVFLFSHLAFGDTQTPNCPTEPLSKSDFTPEGLNQWIQANKDQVHSPRDFICCLPSQTQDKYTIAHSSLAAQNGDANNPRVIFFEKAHHGFELPRFNLQFAFSVNSGRRHLSNPDSIEFMFVDQHTGELSFFDLEISEKFKGFKGGKNPETCMGCHGTDSKFGPKPIFTDQPWHNFVNGSNFDARLNSGAPQCEVVPSELAKAIDLHTIDVLLQESDSNDSNFACLKTGFLRTDKTLIAANNDTNSEIRLNTVTIDISLRRSHRHRVWKDIRNHSGYNRFKYLLIGANYCKDLRIQEWVPESRLTSLINQMDFYDSSLNELNSRNKFKIPNGQNGIIGHALRRLFEERQKYFKRENAFLSVLETPEAFSDFLAHSQNEIYFGPNPIACEPDLPPYQRIQQGLANYSSDQPYLRRIALDNLLARESSNKGNDPILRFVFEGLMGMRSHDMGMSLFPGSSTSLSPWRLPILSQEPAGSALFNLFEEIPLNWSGFSNDMAMAISQFKKAQTPFVEEHLTWIEENPRLFKGRLEPKQVCSELKRLSLDFLR